MEMGLLLMWAIYCFLIQPTRSSVTKPRALDALLHGYGYTSFGAGCQDLRDLQAPPSLQFGWDYGFHIETQEWEFGERGYTPAFQQFHIPPGILMHPPVDCLMLVYQNLGNCSPAYYHMPPNYAFLTPVLGLLACQYHAPNVSHLPDLNITASLHHPISITFPNNLLQPVPRGSVAKCVFFHPTGFTNFTTFFSDNTCAVFQQGHFSVVAHSPDPDPVGGGGSTKMKTRWLIVSLVVVGGAVLVLVVSGLVRCLVVNLKRRRMDSMERAAEGGETLYMTQVGTNKAHVAPFTRTLPTIESEYAS